MAALRTGKLKTELWILSSPAMIAKGVAGSGRERFADRVDSFYGSTDWRRIQRAREARVITPEEYRAEMVNLLRWRLQTDLGYGITERIPMTMLGGQPLYDMVFATDHPVGRKVMTDLYRKAAHREPQMRAEVRQILADRAMEATGQVALFPQQPVGADDVPHLEWTSTEPWRPDSRPWWNN